ncbi:polysaccharide biosynthesis/export family protein [Zunongwangia sp. F260]|uniref:Polysaccharide biosynthesis/export family protein n=1 Tax=Autumnicola lenta TaxID=3075593 RepID=A0ABU3CM76_9FLAO|nr:polysaccharide biosynthesis/export family protein [Zunongwangia sp. F260]MDT0647451.1 polysaccharide biosynthesis/export family protein [Zunongwangia sp. F260]
MLVLCIVFLTTSCVSRKSVAYFQGLETSEQKRLPDNVEIKPDDLLTIRVSAPEQAAALPFNLTKSVMAMGQGTGGGGANVELETYMVSNEGTIEFPVIGTLEVEGLTSIELAAKIKKEVLPYLQDPIVNVRILNFQISVLGEVASPGTFPIEDDHVSLPKALGFAGDVLLTGKRTNILVMREEDGVTTHAYLDLTNADIVSSPYYNLQQNDVVYVEPIGPRRQSASYLGTASSYLSVASVLVSLVLLFTR